jgi:glycosyltransferase involved in cell wall biosynthesis
MRLLFFGDLAATGFGTVTMDLGRELLNLGHDLRFVSQNEVGGELPEPFASRTWKVSDPSLFLPELVEGEGGSSGLGQTSLALRSEGYAGFFNGKFWKDGWTPEACLVLGDPGNVRLMVMRDEQTRAAFSTVPTFHYVPIEGIDLPPTLRAMWSFLRPVAMTEFGADQIAALGIPRPPMVYHGVDSEVFHPVSPERMLVLTVKGKGLPIIHKLRSKADCKKLFGASPDSRLILRTDRNMPRKRYPELFRALAPVLLDRPDTSLIVHCNQMDLGGDLEDSLSKYPPRIRSQIIVTDAGGAMARDMLVALYNAADVYVSNSAEGFGLTIAESLACGTPAVGLDYSSIPEVIGPGGVVTAIGSIFDNEYGYFWAGANQKIFGDAVASMLDNEAERRAMGRAGVQHVRSSFTWTTAARQFSELFTGQAIEVAA